MNGMRWNSDKSLEDNLADELDLLPDTRESEETMKPFVINGNSNTVVFGHQYVINVIGQNSKRKRQ